MRDWRARRRARRDRDEIRADDAEGTDGADGAGDAPRSVRPPDPAPPAARVESECANCGASEFGEHGECPYCGSRGVVHPVARVAARARTGRGDETAARFAALRAHPRFRAAMTARPRVPSLGASAVLPILFGLLFAGTAAGIGLSAHAVTRTVRHDRMPVFEPFETASSAFDGVFSLFTGAFVLIGLAIAGYGVYRLVRWSGAETRAVAALVADRRTEVSGGGRNSSATTTYHVTLETPGGSRREYTVRPSARGQAVAGEIGVAYVHDGTVIGFERFDV